MLRAGFVETENEVTEGESFIVQVSLFDLRSIDMLPSERQIQLDVRTVAGSAGNNVHIVVQQYVTCSKSTIIL